MLSCDVPTIFFGAVYEETTISGEDNAGDRFEITWSGGAPGTQLTRLVINGDKDGLGLSVGDVLFDTQAGLPGAGLAFPFTLVAHDGIDSISATVADGGTQLILDIVGWDPGEKLIFTIDVDEMGFSTPNSLVEGAEFEGTLLTAHFTSTTGHYEDVVASGRFFDAYDHLIPAGLPLPRDGQLPSGEGTQDRTAGVGFTALQPARPFTISGTVYDDRNLNNLQESGEQGIAGVHLELYRLVDGAYVATGLTTVTDANGHYSFTHDCPGTYRVVEIQPPGYFSVGALPGTVGGDPRGVVTTPDVLSQIVMLGGETSIDNSFAEALPVALSGHVYHDANDNGLRDAGELGIAGVTLHLQRDSGPGPNPGPLAVQTDASGFWQVTGLVPGTWSVVELQPAGYFDGKDAVGTRGGTLMAPDTIAGIFLASGESGLHYDFGELLPGSIAGRVFADPNDNGLLDTGEQGIAGVTLYLLDGQGNIVASTLSAADGSYAFTGLHPGVYGVVEVQPAGYFDGQDRVGSLGGVLSANDQVTLVSVGSGQHGVGYDFAEIPPASIAGRVYADDNNNGAFDPGELPIAGVTLELLDADGNPTGITTVTAADGTYAFTDLAPGVYGVRQFQPAGYFDGLDTPGSAGGAAQNPGDRITGAVLGGGVHAVEYNFGELRPGGISGFVFVDGPPIVVPHGTDPGTIDVAALRTGQRTSDDTPLAGVRLLLADASGNLLLDGGGSPITAVTNAQGFYQFSGLAPGLYTVLQEHPAGYLDGVDTPGTTGGVAANAGGDLSAFAGMDHRFDAIAHIVVQPGVMSQENNFSEATWETMSPAPPPPPPPAPPPPPETPPPEIFIVPQDPVPVPTPVPSYVAASPPVPLNYLGLGASQPYAPTNFYGGGGLLTSEVSWHLSIVDAGHPRGDQHGGRFVNVAEARLDVFHAHRAAMQQARWLLRAADGSTREVQFGMPDGIPVTGDWDGDGHTDLGVFRQGEWFLDLDGDGRWSDGDLWAQLGDTRDLPVTGDWDGDGKTDIGIFGPEWPGDRRAALREPGLPDAENQVTVAAKNIPPQPDEAPVGYRLMKRTSQAAPRSDVIDHVFYFGTRGDVPLAGDWNGDGVATIGVFSSGLWILDDNGDGRWLPGETMFEFGRAGDLPVVGDWNGDGIDDVGVYRNGQFILDTNGNRTIDESDLMFALGAPGDLPVVGDWDGDGRDEVGVYQNAPARQE